MSDKGAFIEHALIPQEPRKHPGGRPRRQVDLEQVAALLWQGEKLRKIARQLDLGYGTLHRIVQHLKAQSSADPKLRKATSYERP